MQIGPSPTLQLDLDYPKASEALDWSRSNPDLDLTVKTFGSEVNQTGSNEPVRFTLL
jgi:hypothetical protein